MRRTPSSRRAHTFALWLIRCGGIACPVPWRARKATSVNPIRPIRTGPEGFPYGVSTSSADASLTTADASTPEPPITASCAPTDGIGLAASINVSCKPRARRRGYPVRSLLIPILSATRICALEPPRVNASPAGGLPWGERARAEDVEDRLALDDARTGLRGPAQPERAHEPHQRFRGLHATDDHTHRRARVPEAQQRGRAGPQVRRGARR